MNILPIIRGQLGVSESPLGSNLGPQIRKYKACTWLNPDAPWPWCVAFWQWGIKQTFGKQFPYRTAAVEQLEVYARQHGLTTTAPKPGDAACFHGEHVTFLELFNNDGTFVGIGGNQSNMVRRTTYRESTVSTWVSTSKVGSFLGVTRPPVKKPRFEVVRGEGGQKRVVYTGTLHQATQKAKGLLARGAWGVGIRKKPKAK